MEREALRQIESKRRRGEEEARRKYELEDQRSDLATCLMTSAGREARQEGAVRKLDVMKESTTAPLASAASYFCGLTRV